MQARVSLRVKRWDDFFQFESGARSSFFYKQMEGSKVRLIKYEQEEEGPAPARRVHTSFDSDDFERLKEEDEKKVVQAEQLVQSNRAPCV